MAAENHVRLAVLVLAAAGCGEKTATRVPGALSEEAPLAVEETRPTESLRPLELETEPSPAVPSGMAFIEGGHGVIEYHEVTVASFYYDLHETTVEE